LTGLPDGIHIFKPKIPIGVNFGVLVNFTAIGSILLPFRLFNGHLVSMFCGHFGIYFSRFGMLEQEKSGNRGH
jgi:hypothetical protein